MGLLKNYSRKMAAADAGISQGLGDYPMPAVCHTWLNCHEHPQETAGLACLAGHLVWVDGN